MGMEQESEVVAYVIHTFEDLAIPYLIGGSWALIVWAGPRFTHDIDIVVDMPLGLIPAFCARFPADEFLIDAQAMRAQFRVPDSPSGGMYSFLHMPTGLKIDLFPLRPNDPVQRAAFARRVAMPLLGDQAGMVSTAQDLLIQKVRWWQAGGRASERQFRDCVNLLLTDRCRPTPQIHPDAVEQIMRTLPRTTHEAWRILWEAADQAWQQSQVPPPDAEPPGLPPPTR
jgi:hypothetical protein